MGTRFCSALAASLSLGIMSENVAHFSEHSGTCTVLRSFRVPLVRREAIPSCPQYVRDSLFCLAPLESVAEEIDLVLVNVARLRRVPGRPRVQRRWYSLRVSAWNSWLQLRCVFQFERGEQHTRYRCRDPKPRLLRITASPSEMKNFAFHNGCRLRFVVELVTLFEVYKISKLAIHS